MSTIPNHDVLSCRYIHSRHAMLDTIIKSKILSGTEQDVQARLRTFKNGERLAQEFHHYKKGLNCCTCYWYLLYQAMPQNIKAAADDDIAYKNIFFYEIETSYETFKDENSMNRFKNQKTDPVIKFCWSVEMLDEQRNGNDCIIRLAVRPESGKRPRIQTIMRNFPENAIINNLPATPKNVSNISNYTEYTEYRWEETEEGS